MHDPKVIVLFHYNIEAFYPAQEKIVLHLYA